MEHTDVYTGIVVATALLAVLLALVRARRRAARREAATRARTRARRQRVPLVSANVLGQSARKPDIWRDAAQPAPHDDRAA